MRRYETANRGNIIIFSGLCFSMIRHETRAERNHNPEVGGSNPPPATNSDADSVTVNQSIGKPFQRATKSESIGTYASPSPAATA
jgi:hypothetical protein